MQILMSVKSYFKYKYQNIIWCLRMEDTKEQIKLEAEIKSQAELFLKDFNSTLPESMELEYEGFYRRGFFVTKKRYAVIEDGEIIAK